MVDAVGAFVAFVAAGAFVALGALGALVEEGDLDDLGALVDDGSLVALENQILSHLWASFHSIFGHTD